MAEAAARILTHLKRVDAERLLRETTPWLGAKVAAIKRYQQARFARTYGDLLQSDRYAPAARFFLEELYGPQDFAPRDAQFAQVVPALVRLFPESVIETVDMLAELHSLSESLDTAMGIQLPSTIGTRLDDAGYAVAWRACGQAASRERQIALTVSLGKSLDRLTRKPLLRRSLRMMRHPANAMGLRDLHELLKSGFDAFAVMGGAEDFLQCVGTRERRFSEELFAHGAVP